MTYHHAFSYLSPAAQDDSETISFDWQNLKPEIKVRVQQLGTQVIYNFTRPGSTLNANLSTGENNPEFTGHTGVKDPVTFSTGHGGTVGYRVSGSVRFNLRGNTSSQAAGEAQHVNWVMNEMLKGKGFFVGTEYPDSNAVIDIDIQNPQKIQMPGPQGLIDLQDLSYSAFKSNYTFKLYSADGIRYQAAAFDGKQLDWNRVLEGTNVVQFVTDEGTLGNTEVNYRDPSGDYVIFKEGFTLPEDLIVRVPR